jgi:uncharacterized cupin superfamily protein
MSTVAAGALKVHVVDVSLDPFPVPAEWVIEGDPQGSAAILWKSADGKQCMGIWECTPGLFDWMHTDETASIQQGRVTVTLEDGKTLELGPGDAAFFPEGTKSRWHVHETVRKSFHLHAADGLPF